MDFISILIICEPSNLQIIRFPNGAYKVMLLNKVMDIEQTPFLAWIFQVIFW